MEEYIGAIIGAVAVIIAAVIGLFAKKGKRNKQIIKNVDNSTINQANDSINIGENKDYKG